jgi:uncharacterized metal-binding protein YceD (DUF177 family)
MRHVENKGEIPWTETVVVTDIREDGLQRTVEADEAEREQIARFVGLRDLPRLSAEFALTTVGHSVRVDGRLFAVVGQTCVVTLERVENSIDEAISLLFAPQAAIPPAKEGAREVDAAEEPPEAIADGKIDLAKIAVEFLVLAIDPYPRKPGAVFENIHTPIDPADHPFAALSALKQAPPKAGRAKPRRKGS